MLTRESASFWRENVIAIVILRRVLECRSGETRCQIMEFLSFYDLEKV